MVPETAAVEKHLAVLFSSSHCSSSVLVCLQDEVEKVVSLLQEQARSLSRHGMKKHLRVLPMYSGLPYADQMKVFERVPHSVRKVHNVFAHLPHQRRLSFIVANIHSLAGDLSSHSFKVTSCLLLVHHKHS